MLKQHCPTPPRLQAAGLESGSQKPGHQHVSTISLKHLYEIALVKQKVRRQGAGAAAGWLVPQHPEGTLTQFTQWCLACTWRSRCNVLRYGAAGAARVLCAPPDPWQPPTLTSRNSAPQDTPLAPVESVVKSLMGTCRSMGVKVVARPEDA